MKTYLVVACGSLFIALVATPLAMRAARWLGIIDAPGLRKVHGVPIPRTGGIAIFLGMMALVLPVLLLDNRIGESFRSIHGGVTALLLGGLGMFLVGLWDDVRGLRARTKLTFQLILATAMTLAGIRMDEITILGGVTIEFGLFAYPLTVLWIAGVTNALNLIDGLDGLAAGIASVACAVVAAVAVIGGEPVMAVLMLALLGSLLGFLAFNFNPARVFMGDCGSLFVGFMLGTASVLCTMKTATAVAMATAFLPLGIPVLDMAFSMLRRILERRSPFAPDRGHIHHRLLDMGLSHRHAVLLLYVVTLGVSGLGLLMWAGHELLAAIEFGILLLALVGVFRMAGAIRLRDSFARFRRNMAIAREVSEEKRCFEESQLRLREADSFEHWWGCVCEAAERWAFGRISITLPAQQGEPETLMWRRADERPVGERLLRLSFRLRDCGAGRPAYLEAYIGVNGSLEAAARRGALLGRLIDEHEPGMGLEALPVHVNGSRRQVWATEMPAIGGNANGNGRQQRHIA